MNKLNIALVTNKELHHKYWAYSLYMKNNVKLIIHPNQSLNFFKKMKLKVFKYGFIYSIFKFLSLIFNFLNSKKKKI